MHAKECSMAILQWLMRRPPLPPAQMEEATFDFQSVGHASAVRFLELDAADDAPTIEMDVPPVMNLDFDVADAGEAEVFLRIAAAEHRAGHVAIPSPFSLAEGSRPISLAAAETDGIIIDFDDLD